MDGWLRNGLSGLSREIILTLVVSIFVFVTYPNRLARHQLAVNILMLNDP